MIRINHTLNQKEIKQIMRDIGVDPYGIEIMLPKALQYTVRMKAISNITANILKQEMLSLGGDAAVARGALTGRRKKTDCLIMGNLSQLQLLNAKLNKQPFGLNKLAQGLSRTLKNYQKDEFHLDLGRYKLKLGKRTQIMGIVNLTPDSFSADGLYRKSQIAGRRSQVENIIERVEKMVKDGADIIDVGGESARPGAKPVSLKEELCRTIPAVKILAKKIRIPLSIDTYKPEVARQALDCGAVIVNDIMGLRNPRLAKVIARYKAGVVIMHMQGLPRTMQNNPQYTSLIDEVIEFLDKAISRALEAGIDKDRIIIDPGIGFGKTMEHNLEILNCLAEFKVLGKPILIGASRKSFIGKILGVACEERIFGTVPACVLAAKSGVKILRVHDVKEVRQALKVTDAINNG